MITRPTFTPLAELAREKSIQALILGMIDEGGIKFASGEGDDLGWRFHFHERQDFTEHPPSPMYFNGRFIQSIPYLRNLTADLLMDTIYRNDLGCDFISGVPQGGLHMGGVLGYVMDKGHLHVRTEKKTHGLIDQASSWSIDGKYKPGNRVGTFEDVTTTGESTDKHTAFLRLKELQTPWVISILTYNLGAYKLLNNTGIFLASLFDVDKAVQIACDSQKLSFERGLYIVNYFNELRPKFEALIPLLA